MKNFLILVSLYLCTPSRAQVLKTSRPVHYLTAGTYSQHFTDVYSFTKNQGSLPKVNQTTAGVYTEKRFMLQEFRSVSAAIAFPCLQGGAGISADITGFSHYSESQVGMAYGKSLSPWLALGVQFNYNRLSLEGYGTASAVTFEIGTVVQLTEKIYSGCHFYNPVGGMFGNGGEKLSSVYSIGGGYEASEKLFLGFDVSKEENRPADINLVLHYAFDKQFFLRTGISTVIGNYFAGAGILYKNFRLDVAADWHPQAGLTPSLVLVFMLSKVTMVQE